MDTTEGLTSLQFVADHNVPYAMLLYERFLGSPFISHRNAVSEEEGVVMESAVASKLDEAGIDYRPTRKAEVVPGFEQAPDFIVPDEVSPEIVIEARVLTMVALRAIRQDASGCWSKMNAVERREATGLVR